MEQICTGYDLVEGPAWDDGDGSLAFCDWKGGGIFRVVPGSSPEVVVPARTGIGGVRLHAAGGVVASGLTLSRFDGEAEETLAVPPAGLHHFNDFTTDASGRVWAGVMAERAPGQGLVDLDPGCIVLIELDGTVRVVHSGTRVPNGMVVSPDGSRLYACESASSVLLAFDITAAGELENGSELLSWPNDDGSLPDGLTVDEEGLLYVALYGLGVIAVVSPEGEELDRLSVPDLWVTSACFGGEDRSTLFVTTGGGRGGVPAGGGSVYSVDIAARGAPVADVAVRGA